MAGDKLDPGACWAVRQRAARPARHLRRRSLQREHRAPGRPPGLPRRARPPDRRHREHPHHRHLDRGRSAPGRLAAGARRRRLERRAPLPGRPLRDRDAVPAPRVRGVRPQGAARHQPVRAVRLHPDRRGPGHHRRVRPRRLPLRPLDADGHHPADQRRRLAQRHQAARRVPQPGRVLQERDRHPHLGRRGRLDHHGPVRPDRQGDRRVRHQHAAQQPAGPAARPARDQHDPGPQRGHPAAERGAPADLRRDQRRAAQALHQLDRLRAAAQAPRVAGELRRGLRHPHRRSPARPPSRDGAPPPTGSSTARSFPARTAS